MEIEYDDLTNKFGFFMKIEKVLQFWGRDPETFSTLQDGEELYYKQLVLNCGVTEQTVQNIFTYSLVCESNNTSTRPEPVEVRAVINFLGFSRDMSMKEVQCSGCGNDIKCKHAAAVLIYLNRHDITVLPDIVGKDLSKIKDKIMKNFYNDSDESSEEEEEVPPFTIVDGIKYDNSEGVPPRERFHIRVMEAFDKNKADRKARGEEVPESEEETSNVEGEEAETDNSPFDAQQCAMN